MELKIYKDKKEVAQEFSKFLVNFIAERKMVHIALSGGSTPKIVFDTLASEYAEKIDWEKVHLYWGDERCVSPMDDDSNYKMTVEHLLSKITIPKDNIHRIKGESKPDHEAERYSEVLKQHLSSVQNVPQFDLVILGMGDDGHTASIFPHEIDLWYSNSLCEVAIHPGSGQKRISITGKVINNAETIAFLVTGESKAEKVTAIIGQQSAFEKYPAALVAPGSDNLIWFLDTAAAKGVG